MKKIVIYTPTYYSSPGIRYRADMMKKALKKHFSVNLIIDEREHLLRKLYHSLGQSLLKNEWIYRHIGKIIAKKIFNDRPDMVILLIDISASAIPYLKKRGIPVILSIEDLTSMWLNFKDEEKFLSILGKYVSMSDKVIVVSDDLQRKLSIYGVKSDVVPPGLEKINVDLNYALSRVSKFRSVLHAGKLQTKEEVESFIIAVNQLSGKYKIKSYFVDGKHYRILKRMLPQIEWYNYPSAENAVDHVKCCFAGLIIRYKAHAPTRLYYHASMLQPIIGIGDTWLKMITQNKLGIISSPIKVLEGINYILDNYKNYVFNMYEFAKKNELENAYSPVIKFLNEIK